MTLYLAPLTLLGAFSAVCLVAVGQWWPVAVVAAWVAVCAVLRGKVKA